MITILNCFALWFSQVQAQVHAQAQAQAPVPRPQIQPTNSTRERAEGVKAYIEAKYSRMKNEETEKKEAWDKLAVKMD